MNEGNSNTGSAADELSAELLQFCESNSLSEEGLCKIIEKYELTSDHNLHGDNNFSHAFFLDACNNERVTEDIIRLLIEYFPDAPRVAEYYERTPLHVACENKSASLKMIQLLIEAAPDSVRHADEEGDLPIHRLCSVADGNLIVQMKVLKMLLDKYPESIRQTNCGGDIPLHCAAYRRSPEIFQLLVESHPGAILVGDYYEKLPLHIACMHNNLFKVNYFYNLYPDAINRATSSGHYPIHYAIMSDIGRRRAAPDIVQFLLNSDPRVKLQNWKGGSLLHYACMQNYDDLYENVGDCVQMIEAIYEAHPESIRYTDERGNLPIHLLCNCNDENFKKDEKVAVTILKLLLDKYPESTKHTNNTGNLPLHYACRKKSPEFCQLLIELYPDSVRVSDSDGGLPLHYACLSNTLPTVEYLYILYPYAAHQAKTNDCYYPVHSAIVSQHFRKRPLNAVCIVQFLLDCDPRIKLQRLEGEPLLHFACKKNYDNAKYYEASASVQMIKAINDADPHFIRCTNENGSLPIHSLCLCYAEKVESQKVVRKVLKLLLEIHPDSTRHTDHQGNLPLHHACRDKSPEFCKLLIESYPDSVRVSNINGILPLHFACNSNTHLLLVEYLYKLYPNAVYHTTSSGFYPIHCVIMGPMLRDSAKAAVSITQFLLDCDPCVKLQKYQSKSLLSGACGLGYTDANIETGMQIIGAIYDSNPEAIEDDTLAILLIRNVGVWHEQVKAFLSNEIIYARQASYHRQMMRRDENGQLPLHRALRNNVRLGSIKLLLNGNPSAPSNADNNSSFPLHLACQYHDSPRVIEHLIDCCPTTIRHTDFDRNTVLHYACRGANYRAVAFLLDKYGATSVSMRNVHNELPIGLLFKSSAAEDRESIEYTDCVFRLLRAYPETMTMKRDMQMGRTSSGSATSLSHSPRLVG